MRKILLYSVICLLTYSCSQREEMHQLLQQLLQEDRHEVVFRTDTLALRLVDYFSLHGTMNEQMEAYYLLGRAYDNMKNPSLALRFYYEAVQKVDTTEMNIDNETLSRAYAHSAKLFLAHFDCRPTLALEDARKALCYAKTSNNQLMIDICKEQLGNCFFALGLWDSIKVYDPQRYEWMYHPWKSSPGRIMFKYQSFIPTLNNKYNESQKVYVFYNIPLDSIPEDVKAKGNILVGGGLSHAIEHSTDRDSIMNQSNISSFVEMKLQSQQKLYHQRNMFFLSLVILLFIIMIGYYWLKNIQRKEREKMQYLNTQYNLDLANYQIILSELNLMKQSSEHKEKAIEDKQEQLSNLQEKITNLQEDSAIPSVWNIPDDIMLSPLVMDLHKKASIGGIASNGELRDLLKLANSKMPTFISSLSSLDKTLDDENLVICILTKLRFLPSEMSILLGKSSQVITNRKARMLKYLFKVEGGTRQFDHQIRSL